MSRKDFDVKENIDSLCRATQYIKNNSFSYQDIFRTWGMLIMDKIGIGGMRFGNIWVHDPETWGSYEWFINNIFPKSSEDMLLFCQCKMRVEVFLLAKLDRYDLIEQIANKED